MSGHTPGPWESSYRHDPITGAECAVWGPDGDMVAMVFASLMNDPDGTSTARLIAAVPDMFDALVAIMNSIVLKTKYIENCDCQDCKAIRSASLAIAKAEGKS